MTHCKLEDLKKSLNSCLQFLKAYDYLSDLYIIEFFTDNHWKKLPSSWQNVLSAVDPFTLIGRHPISRTCELHTKDAVWPLSLLCFIRCVSVLPLSRSRSSLCEEENVCLKRLKHVSPKKGHEIQALAEKIQQVYVEENCTTVIDVGSGQGHLSRLLGLDYNFPVVALEHEPEYVKMAKKFDIEAVTSVHCKKPEGRLPIHLSYTVSPDVDQEDFIEVLNCSDDSSPSTRRCLLTGLHACGDLSATMIRLFVETPSIRSLVSVSCCYIKLTTDSDDPGKNFKSQPWAKNKTYYPMSEHAKSVPHHKLSYRALKLACHGLESLKDNLHRNDPRLKVQNYRAVLEYLIRERHPELKRPAVKTIKNAHRVSFNEYANVAFERLGLEPPNDNELNRDEIRAMLIKQNQVIVVFTLAFMLGPLIESVILLDRMIYLEENGLSSSVETLFEPTLSPRCFAVISSKSSS